jgi:uncharacterized lipoprotein YajG
MKIPQTILASGVLFGALLFSGCAFNPQTVTFNRNLSLAPASIGEGKSVSVTVKDERADTALGRRGTAYGAAASINSADKMDEVIRDKFIAGLKQLGFSVDAGADRKVLVELRLLSYATSTGFWTGGIDTKGNVKVVVSIGSDKFEKNYRAEAEERVMVVPTAERNAELLNIILDKTLQKVFEDEEFRNFLKK